MEKFEKVTMYLYDLEVKYPLLVLLSFLGQQPVESVNWNEEEFRQGLQSIFGELGRGLTNIDYYDPQLVPNNVLSQVHDLQESPYFVLVRFI